MKTPRPLTSAEIDLARSVFGTAIDYAQVTIRDGKFMPLQPRNSGMAPDGHIYMYGCYRDDYAQGSLAEQGFFIHEMTHVWQFQNKVLHPVAGFIDLLARHKFNYAAAYYYNLDGVQDLTDYNMEQQASLVQDHFILTRGGNPQYRGRCLNKAPLPETLALMEKALSRFCADPAYARRAQFPILPKASGGKKAPPAA